jgi:hypothetical protein
VCVGNYGTILSSQDKEKWTSASSLTGYDLNSITYGENKFVAVGNGGVISSSSDGIEWSKCVLPGGSEGESLIGIANGNDLFMAVSEYTILRSMDGITWSKSADNEGLNGIVFSDGKFFVYSDSAIFSSSDGNSWSKLQTANRDQGRLTVYNIVQLASGNKTLVGVSENGNIVRSKDGKEWESTWESNDFYYISQVIFREGKFVFCGHNTIGTSIDGKSWQEFDLIKYRKSDEFWNLVDNNGKCMISNVVRENIQKQTKTEAEIKSIVYAKGKYVAVGEAGTIVTLQKE